MCDRGCGSTRTHVSHDSRTYRDRHGQSLAARNGHGPMCDRDHGSDNGSTRTYLSHNSQAFIDPAPAMGMAKLPHGESYTHQRRIGRNSEACEQNDEDSSPTGGNLSLQAIFKPEDSSTTKLIGSKTVHSIARSVGPEGGQLVLNNVGISLLVPEGAVPAGETKTITLVLDWDLTDNPSLTRHQSLVSPVLYVGPHGLQLQKHCVLSFKHCSFDPRMIQVYYSETQLLDGKNWSVLCDKDNNQGTTFFTQEECQIRITSFTLYTCVQTPSEGIVGKKWLQIAAFSYPLRPDIIHHQVRIYMLNKTPCALQWAIQKEAKFGGRLCCPEKVFLFVGDEQDLILDSRYVSEQWERTDTIQQERVKFLNIWHGQCPYVSMCFRRRSASSHELGFQFFVFQENLEFDGEKMVVHITEDPSAPPPFMGTCEKHKDEQIRVNISNNIPKLRNIIFGFNDVEHLPDFLPERNIPQCLRAKMKIFLDPPNAFDNNWKTLASRLGLDSMIPVMENWTSPTECLLQFIDHRKIPLAKIQEHLYCMERHDVCDVITTFLDTQTKEIDDGS
ncbi:hypothetical protein ScPMuIL_009722 [Solemya velum]